MGEGHDDDKWDGGPDDEHCYCVGFNPHWGPQKLCRMHAQELLEHVAHPTAFPTRPPRALALVPHD